MASNFSKAWSLKTIVMVSVFWLALKAHGHGCGTANGRCTQQREKGSEVKFSGH